MARSKVSQGTRAPKKRAEKPVSEGIKRAAERAGIRNGKPPLDEAPVTFPRHEIRRMYALLGRAQQSALMAAPRAVPFIRSGAQSALDAFDDMHMVREELSKRLLGVVS